ncbi:hypothetical protein ACS0TY_001679 [Phlomoides rotata]
MNRILKLAYTKAIANSPKCSRGFSVLQNENSQTPMKFQHLCRRNAVNVQSRYFSSSFKRVDEKAIEEEAERKIGGLLKIMFVCSATVIGYNLFPYLGENVMQQSVQLLRVKDPLFKRMGASRLARFAIDDKKRMRIVEMGGAEELVNMLVGAKDDKTRKQALKALAAISKSDGAVEALHKGGALPVIRSTLDSDEFKEIEEYKSKLLARFRDLRYDDTSS